MSIEISTNCKDPPVALQQVGDIIAEVVIKDLRSIPYVVVLSTSLKDPVSQLLTTRLKFQRTHMRSSPLFQSAQPCQKKQLQDIRRRQVGTTAWINVDTIIRWAFGPMRAFVQSVIESFGRKPSAKLKCSDYPA